MKGTRFLKAVLIGTGAISGVHARSVRSTPGMELTACWNRTMERGIKFAQEHGVKYYEDLREMLDRENADIVINALGQKYHLLGLEQAAAKGAFLIIEKPMGLTVACCREMLELEKKYKVKIAVSESVAFNRVNLFFARNREIFGKVIHTAISNYRYYFSPDRAQWFFDPADGAGGMILNVGVHKVAQMRMITGGLEVAVCASVGKRYPERPVEGDCSIFIRYDNGASGILLMCGYHDPGMENRNFSRVVTERGYADLGDPIRFTESNGDSREIPADHFFSGSDYDNFYQEIASSIKNDLPSPYSSHQGMTDVAVIEAAIKSEVENREVTIREIMGNV